MLQYPLLQTKLYIPSVRPDLVSRPRLIERLNAGLHHKLTIISAPAGFGKTTLVTQWLKSAQCLSTWLSLDESDNDAARFLMYLVAALQTIQVDVGQSVLGALQSPQPPPAEAVLTSVINDVAALPDGMILVLDDYHLIEAQAIHDALTFLLEHLPPQMHLVIASREDPPLPLARLRARGQLTELRATNLRFTTSEAAEFLNQAMGLDLSADEIAALETRTEGWIAGLQLAALALQGTLSMQGREDTPSLIKSFTGSHRFVLDYLVEEVLQLQTASIQTFLLQTAILDRLTGSLCDAVRFGIAEAPSTARADAARFGVGKVPPGQHHGQGILEMLDHANLFIVPLDNERYWYRYHHLFADLLRQRLHQTQAERLPILHYRASEWYEQQGFATEAIEHALRGGYFERAAALIEDHLGDNYERVDPATLRHWLAEFPEESVSSRPDLCILHAWNLFTSGQLDATEQSLQAAEKMLSPDADQEFVSSPDKDQLSETFRMKLAGRVAAIRSFLASYSGDMPRTIRYARQALEYLPEQELPWRTAVFIALGDAHANQGEMVAAYRARSDALVAGKASGDTHILMMANLRLAEILRQQGQLQQVIDICERQFKSADGSGMSDSAIVGWLLGIWGEVLAELNHLDRAIDRANKGVTLTAGGGDVLYEVMSNLCLVRVLFSGGDIAGAEDVIQSMQNTAREYELPLWANLQLSSWQVRIWLAQGNLEVASQWVRERELAPYGEPAYLHEVEHIAFARILIAQGELDEAGSLLHRLLVAAEAGGRTAKAIEILNLQALAFQVGGDTAQATITLGKALTLAEPGGFVRIFVDEGLPMAHLLYEALSREIVPEYVRRLLGAFPIVEPVQPDPTIPQVPKTGWIEPLSERELEVLHSIADGLTNPEIASRLFISLNTVKAHCKNIYGKLNVHNRTQAITRSQALGLLPRK